MALSVEEKSLITQGIIEVLYSSSVRSLPSLKSGGNTSIPAGRGVYEAHQILGIKFLRTYNYYLNYIFMNHNFFFKKVYFWCHSGF